MLTGAHRRARPLTGTCICRFSSHSHFPNVRRIDGKGQGYTTQSNRTEICNFSVKSAIFQLASSLVDKFQARTHKHVGTAVLSSILNECTYSQRICAYSVQTASRFSALSLEQPPNTSNTLEHTENRTTQRHDRVSVPSLKTSFFTLFHFVSMRSFILQSTTMLYSTCSSPSSLQIAPGLSSFTPSLHCPHQRVVQSRTAYFPHEGRFFLFHRLHEFASLTIVVTRLLVGCLSSLQHPYPPGSPLRPVRNFRASWLHTSWGSQTIGLGPIGSKPMLCPCRMVRHAQVREEGDSAIPQNKRLHITPSTKSIPRYIVGGGPIKQQRKRGTHYHHNVQENVLYTIPYQYPARRNPAICYAGQPKGTHITTISLCFWS